MINNHRCDVKKALSKEEIAKAQQMDRDRAERGTRSRGNTRGGWGNERGAPGGGGGGAAWGGAPGGGYGAPQPWGPPNAGYPGYGPPAAAGKLFCIPCLVDEVFLQDGVNLQMHGAKDMVAIPKDLLHLLLHHGAKVTVATPKDLPLNPGPGELLVAADGIPEINELSNF